MEEEEEEENQEDETQAALDEQDRQMKIKRGMEDNEQQPNKKAPWEGSRRNNEPKRKQDERDDQWTEDAKEPDTKDAEPPNDVKVEEEGKDDTQSSRGHRNITLM